MRFPFRSALVALAPLALLLAAPVVRAQTLTGTYVRYCDVGRTGSLLNGSRSVAYGEVVGSAACDIYAQGTFVEGYDIFGTRGASSISVSVNNDTPSGVTGVVATVSGRTISWASSAATAGLAISQELTYATADRSVRIRVTLRNTGATAITNLYYSRHSDPDQAFCGSSDYVTANDVVRQGPGAGGSLITATAAGVSVGIGSFDSRARASAESGGAISDWTTPFDPAGASSDGEVTLIFREPTLAAGASTTFEMFYVFGATSLSAASRFDGLAACFGEGSVCSSGAATGTCRAGACCTGCWDGVACNAGSSVTSCGRNGGACGACNDGNVCTTDSCTAGSCAVAPVGSGAPCDDGNVCTSADVCTVGATCTGSAVSCDDGLACTSDSCVPAVGCASTIASGCAIDGACVASGTPSPFNVCLGCVPTDSRDSWSPRIAGTPCGVQACESGTTLPAPTCDVSGTCVDGAAAACTTGRCNLTGDACEGAVPPDLGTPDMGTPDLDGGTTMVDAGPGVDGGPGSDGGASGSDGGGTPIPGGRSGRRAGCAVSAGAESVGGGLFTLSLLGLAAMVLTRRRKR